MPLANFLLYTVVADVNLQIRMQTMLNMQLDIQATVQPLPCTGGTELAGCAAVSAWPSVSVKKRGSATLHPFEH